MTRLPIEIIHEIGEFSCDPAIWFTSKEVLAMYRGGRYSLVISAAKMLSLPIMKFITPKIVIDENLIIEFVDTSDIFKFLIDTVNCEASVTRISYDIALSAVSNIESLKYVKFKVGNERFMEIIYHDDYSMLMKAAFIGNIETTTFLYDNVDKSLFSKYDIETLASYALFGNYKILELLELELPKSLHYGKFDITSAGMMHGNEEGIKILFSNYSVDYLKSILICSRRSSLIDGDITLESINLGVSHGLNPAKVINASTRINLCRVNKLEDLMFFESISIPNTTWIKYTDILKSCKNFNNPNNIEITEYIFRKWNPIKRHFPENIFLDIIKKQPTTPTASHINEIFRMLVRFSHHRLVGPMALRFYQKHKNVILTSRNYKHVIKHGTVEIFREFQPNFPFEIVLSSKNINNNIRTEISLTNVCIPSVDVKMDDYKKTILACDTGIFDDNEYYDKYRVITRVMSGKVNMNEKILIFIASTMFNDECCHLIDKFKHITYKISFISKLKNNTSLVNYILEKMN